MEPTIMADETIQVQLDAYRTSSPQRWDVVAFRPPLYSVPVAIRGEDLGVWVFRVVGLPGDNISFGLDGLLINGKSPGSRPPSIKGIEYKLTTASGIPSDPHSLTYPLTLLDEQYFVLGDHPDQSNDSRLWGILEREKILGQVKNK